MLTQTQTGYLCDGVPLPLPVGYLTIVDIVVMDTNPEMADMDNPRGELYGFASYVVAEWGDGSRRRSPAVARNYEEATATEPAEKLASALRARLENYGKPHPQIAAWAWEQPGYGTDAYLFAQANGDLGPENY